jgi:4-diphosphocytidyl-2-C-methyl-D-erythritol kinase
LAFTAEEHAPARPTAEGGLTLPSFAKINLTLRVLGRRPDGYHEIETVLQTITLRDRLSFRALDSDTVELACDAPDIPADGTNLVHRAAAALRERFGVRQGALIKIGKRIPAGGGLGGGSSNAAVALVALSHLWGLETGAAELSEIGASLGSDVPFFLSGGTGRGTGRGERIEPLADAPRAHLLVVSPPVKVATAEAYKLLNAPALTKVGAAVNFYVSREGAIFDRPLREALANDFEPAVTRNFPEIERARDALTQAGAQAAMLSGSGSSVFGVFDSRGGAKRAREFLSGEQVGRVFLCETLSRERYRGAFGACARYLA